MQGTFLKPIAMLEVAKLLVECLLPDGIRLMYVPWLDRTSIHGEDQLSRLGVSLNHVTGCLGLGLLHCS